LLTVLLAVGAVAVAQEARLPVGAIQGAPERFEDVPEGHWAAVAVERLVALGIVTGYPDQTFQGTRGATRYELAVIAARLIDYLDGMLGLLADDEAFVSNLREVARDLREAQDYQARIARIERALEEAASLAYVEALEARIAALEGVLNELLGEERFPGMLAPDGELPRTAAEAVPPPPGTAVAEDAGPTALVDEDAPPLRLATPRDNRFYLGLSPGIVSTGGQVAIGVQLGADFLAGPVGAVMRLGFHSGDDELRLSLDAIVRLVSDLPSVEFYGGLGAGVSLRPAGAAVLLEAPFGAEYLVSERIGLFLQLTPSYAFAPIGRVDAALTAGVNLRF
jgi:hypothetical protein